MDEQVEALQNEALTRHIDLGLTLSDSDKLEKLFNLMTSKMNIPEQQQIDHWLKTAENLIERKWRLYQEDFYGDCSYKNNWNFY